MVAEIAIPHRTMPTNGPAERAIFAWPVRIDPCRRHGVSSLCPAVGVRRRPPNAVLTHIQKTGGSGPGLPSPVLLRPRGDRSSFHLGAPGKRSLVSISASLPPGATYQRGPPDRTASIRRSG